MNSKKWRPIILKNSHLRQIRMNLRTVLDLAIKDELERLHQLSLLYTRKIRSKLTTSQGMRYQSVTRKREDLSNTFRNSILHCSSPCSMYSKTNHNINMVWNPVDKQWLCINCYENYYGNEKYRKFYEACVKSKNTFQDRMFKRQQEEYNSYVYKKDYAEYMEKYMEKEVFCLVGKFTKFTRKEAKILIDDAGGVVQLQINRNLDYLILAKSESLPYYRNTLRNRKTRIIHESKFLEFMGEVYSVW